MYVLDFKKNGEHLYTVFPRPGGTTYNILIDELKDYNNLLFNRQHLSFFNPMFVRRVRDHCSFTPGFYTIQHCNVIPDRVDVRYLR